MVPTKHEIVRSIYGVAFEERASFKDTYGGEAGHVFLECVQIRPRDRESKTAVVFSHPIGGGAFLPIMAALARAGHHVVYVNTRYRGNDTALVMEKCLLDLGAAIRDAKRRFGYERIVLGGWSGGGSLALFYQEQASRPSITATPAGDLVDVAGANLIAGDAVFLVAAHLSRAATLTDWIDPSILDEARPGTRDAELSLYGDPPRHAPPYTGDFLGRYRAAQLARNRRITAWSTSGCPSFEREVGRTTRSASSFTARWPIRAGSIHRSSRTAENPGSAISAIRAS